MTQVLLFSRLLGCYKVAIAAGLGIAAYNLLVGAEPAVVEGYTSLRMDVNG